MNGFHGRKVITALNQAATITATQTYGADIDCLGYDFVEFNVQVGTSTTADANNYMTVSLVHGDAATPTTAVDAAAGLVGSNLIINATADANKSNHIGYKVNKRYVRLVIDETGTASVQICATATLSKANFEPVTNTDLTS
jgi:hypothetical protein